jgi:glycosyltransferase involved in cell wall biosynthesis
MNEVFKDVMTVFVQEWVGIRAAAGSFPGSKLAVSHLHEWGTADLQRVLDHMSSLGIKKVVAHGFSPGLARLLIALRRAAPELRIYGVWHGALAAWCIDAEKELANQFLTLADRGIFDRIHFLKLGMHLLHRKAFAPLLPNPVPLLNDTRVRPAMLDRPITCIFGGWNNAWKNMYANVIGAAACSEVEKVLTYAPLDLGAPLGKKIRQVGYRSRNAHFALLSTCDLVLNATIVDCHPMVELEGLAVGTPAIRSDLEFDFGRDHEYSRRFTLATPQNPADIASRIKNLAGSAPNELAEVVREYRELVTRTSFERFAEFLEV